MLIRRWNLWTTNSNYMTHSLKMRLNTITITYDSGLLIKGGLNIYNEIPLLDKFVLLRGYGVSIVRSI